MPNEAAKKALNVLADLERAPADTPAPDAKSKALQALDELDAQQSQPASVTNRGTGIETSPLEVPEIGARERFQAGATDARFRTPLMPATEPQGPDPMIEKAAAAGVLYDKPAPSGHALASLAFSVISCW